jgi:hypothetical protein
VALPRRHARNRAMTAPAISSTELRVSSSG